MLLFIIVFLFFLIHIQFLIRNLLFGVNESYFYYYKQIYPFNEHIALETLFFSLLCIFAFTLLYKISYSGIYSNNKTYHNSSSKLNSVLMNFFGLITIFYLVNIILLSNFDYEAMVSYRSKSGFIFQLGIIYLIFLSNLLLNIGFYNLLHSKQYLISKLLLIFYIVLIIMFQARSELFEISSIIIYTYLMWHNDRFKTKYVFILFICICIPNILVLGRMGIPSDINVLVSSIFSIEYGMIYNNFVSAAIVNGYISNFSFLPSLALLIPSPIRDLFDISVVKSSYYEDITSISKVRGGSFSLLAEVYSNFMYFGIIVFGLFGYILGYFNKKARNVGNCNFIASIGPILYAQFLISFRNDFGVLIKYFLQILLISFFLELILNKLKYLNK